MEEKRNMMALSLKNEYEITLKNINIPKFILGINKYADSLHLFLTRNNISLSGFIDDFTDEKMYHNIKIYKMNEISDKNSIIFSCVVDGKPLTAKTRLEQNGFIHIIDYYHLLIAYPQELIELDYCSENRDDINQNIKMYDWVYENLNDTLSKQTLNLLVDFRYNYDLEVMKFFHFSIENQYFEDFIKFSKNEVFVDGGGFDGETTKQFIKLCPDYQEIYLFEPNPTAILNAKSNLKDNNSIQYYTKGLWDENCILKFNNDLGSASKISETGEISIDVVTLDEMVHGPVHYIKFDLEGAEYNAIRGAENTIKCYKPKLAICVYHNQSDFWRIPLLIKQYRNDYKIFLRHYTEGILETVMYFI